MRVLLYAFAMALLMPFAMGFMAAFLLPPLCWWAETRAAKRKAALANTAPVGVDIEQAVLNEWAKRTRKGRPN